MPIAPKPLALALNSSPRLTATKINIKRSQNTEDKDTNCQNNESAVKKPSLHKAKLKVTNNPSSNRRH